MLVFLNGQFVPESEAVVSVHDRGFLYGDGLFETTRVCNGRAFRLAQHLERLVRGAEYLKIRLPFAAKELSRFAKELIERNQMPEAVLRLVLTRGCGPRGYTPKDADAPTVVMELCPALPLNPGEPLEWDMITSSYHPAAADPLANLKTTSKLLNVMARLEAHERGADEALLVNTSGEVAEAAGANLFWIYRERVCTVPTGRGVLPGISRAVVLEICQAQGLPVMKPIIKPSALRNAEAIFVSQSVHGLVSIRSLDGEHVGQSPIVESIHRAFCDAFCNADGSNSKRAMLPEAAPAAEATAASEPHLN